MSALYEYDLICIGSGPAAIRAAIQAAKLGRRAAVVEKARMLGGSCLRTGTIPSKTFREAVRTMTADTIARSMHATGLQRVRPTMPQLVARVQEVIETEATTTRAMLDRNDVTVIPGMASFIDAHTLRIEATDATRVLQAAHVLIATGSRAILPPGVRCDGETIFSSDNILEMRELPHSMTVMGAGVIGIEFASMFAAAGVLVTLVDKVDRPLGFVDRELIDELMHQLRALRVTFRMNEEVDQVEVTEASPRRAAVVTRSGKRIVSDVILISAGRVGNVENLELEAVGIQADDRGRLKVDEHYRTDVPTIYAAGDVIGFPGLAATSYEQGRLAACHMFGERSEPMGEHYPYGIYAIPEISMVGATEEQLTKACVPYEIGVARYGEIARGLIRGADAGVLKLIFHRDTRQLLGVHCIGEQATELIHIGQAVLRLGGGLDYFLQTVFNYPTFAECYKTAALNAHNRLRLSASASPARDTSAPVARPAPEAR
ncbi:MAG: Si-specific NAD(P)(+) transhydrogenase [Phycisphaeraceae bacterium]|nr:Si-specific NAD(P)(+) transhydrogenase [Phycisphaeraceae bacterium]